MNAASNSKNEFKNTLVKVAPDLFKIIQSVGAIGDTLPIKNVVDLFGYYLGKKGLLNRQPDGRKFINCNDDHLSKLFFGEHQIYLSDLMYYLKNYFVFLPPRNLEPCDEVDGPSTRNAASVDQVDGLKRKRTESQDEDEGRKKLATCGTQPPTKESYQEFHISKPSPYDARPESPLPVQFCETEPECNALFNDSEFELSPSSEEETWQDYEVELESEDFSSIEYEVESLDSASKSWDSIGSETESDVEEIVGTLIVCQDDSDKEFWADASSDEEEPISSDDAQLEDNLVKFSDKWECTKCRFLNSVTARFCEKCWQKGPFLLWQLGSERLPPSWHRRRNKHLQFQEGSDGSQAEYSSQENGGLVVSQPDVSHLCSLCLEWPKTGIIVHGRTSHQVCCFHCASKLWKRQEPCPVCRRRIQRVTRNYVA